VTRCPSLSLAPSALVQLDSACALFSKAARGFKAEKVLVRFISISLRGRVLIRASENTGNYDQTP